MSFFLPTLDLGEGVLLNSLTKHAKDLDVTNTSSAHAYYIEDTIKIMYALSLLLLNKKT